jgi:hypothetical protein
MEHCMNEAHVEVRRLPVSVIVRTIRSMISWLSWLALFIAPPVLRITLAVPFFRSGLTKATQRIK